MGYGLAGLMGFGLDYGLMGLEWKDDGGWVEWVEIKGERKNNQQVCQDVSLLGKKLEKNS